MFSATALVVLSACVGAAIAQGPSDASATPGLPTGGSIADVAEHAVESVVNVSSTRTVAAGPAGTDPWFTDPRSPFYQGPDGPSERESMAAGSGVIVSQDGRVLTNAHVVEGGGTVRVSLSDGTELDARVVGIDRRSDVAVLQLEGTLPTLRPIAIGDSSKLRLGDVVLAIGNPFGVGQAVSMGIVSAQGRASLGIQDYEDFIQTDAAINPGNSGGALVNMAGELVGINTAILSRSGGYQGIGFAIPSNMALPIAEMLAIGGKVSRGYLGIGVATVTRAIAEQQQLPVERGVLVSGEIAADSPAGTAGLQAGDVITALDGAPMRDAGKLRNTIAMKGAGATVVLEVARGKATKTIKVKLGELPEAPAATRSRRSP